MGDENFIKPTILKSEDLDSFKDSHKEVKFIDAYIHQLKELTKIDNPGGQPDQAKEYESLHVYLPWADTLLKTVGPGDLFRLRTNRNQELITTEEQTELSNKIVGVAGMSVGAGIALGLFYSGISREIKIADHDRLDNSNLNRLRESLLNIGKLKAHLAAQHIYELDPFAQIHIFDRGINDDNISQFFNSPKVNLIVDEIDDFKMKLKLRQQARKEKIPVIMLTSLGDNILIDIERYDLDETQRIFNGILSNEEESELLNKTEITPEDEKRYAVKLVGPDYIPTRALESVLKIGTELVGRPQLYSTIAIDGGLASFIIREILLGRDVPAGRYFIQFSDLFNLEDSSLKKTPEREAALKRLFN